MEYEASSPCAVSGKRLTLTEYKRPELSKRQSPAWPLLLVQASVRWAVVERAVSALTRTLDEALTGTCAASEQALVAS